MGSIRNGELAKPLSSGLRFSYHRNPKVCFVHAAHTPLLSQVRV
jgi:hypothetical protein